MEPVNAEQPTALSELPWVRSPVTSKSIFCQKWKDGWSKSKAQEEKTKKQKYSPRPYSVNIRCLRPSKHYIRLIWVVEWLVGEHYQQWSQTNQSGLLYALDYYDSCGGVDAIVWQ